MPEYDYKCGTCDHVFSIKKPFTKATRKETCPVCRNDARKVWTTTAVSTSCGSGSSSFG